MTGSLAACWRTSACMLLLVMLANPASSVPQWAQHAEATKAAARKLSERHWHSQVQRLQSLELDARRFGDILGHIMRHEYTLPIPQVQKSLVYTGANFRLRKLVHDMILGKRPFKVGAIGGSITNGAKASVIGETDWFRCGAGYVIVGAA